MITVQLDMTEFDRWLAAYLRRTSRDIPSALNKRAFFILIRTIKMLPKTKAAKIRQELNGPSRVPGAPLGGLIVNKKRRQQGLPGVTGSELKKEMRKLVKKRVASIGFLKSFFVKAVKQLSLVIGRNFKPTGDWGRPNSKAQVAMPGARAEVVFESTAGDNLSGPIVAKALQKSLDIEALEIARHMSGALDPSSGAARRLAGGTN